VDDGEHPAGRSANFAFWSNKDFDTLVAAAKAEQDPKQATSRV